MRRNYTRQLQEDNESTINAMKKLDKKLGVVYPRNKSNEKPNL